MRAQVLLVVLAASAADAASFAEREAESALRRDQLATTNKGCESTIVVDVDWSSFNGKYAGIQDEHWAADLCGNILRSIGDYCARGDEERETVSTRIKQLRCRYDRRATAAHLMRAGAARSYDMGVLSVGYNWETMRVGDELESFYLELGLQPVAPDRAIGVDPKSAALEGLKEGALREANDACEAELALALDWRSFKRALDDEHREEQAAERCGQVLGGLRDFCRARDAHRAGVGRALKKVSCRFDKKASERRLRRTGASYKLKRKVLSAGFNWKSQSLGGALAPWLQKKLRIKPLPVVEEPAGPCAFRKSKRRYVHCAKIDRGVCKKGKAPCQPESSCVYSSKKRSYVMCTRFENGKCLANTETCEPTRSCVYTKGKYVECKRFDKGRCVDAGATCTPG